MEIWKRLLTRLLIALTRQGVGRGVLRHTRSGWLWQLDMAVAMEQLFPPGLIVLEWTADWSVETMTEIVAEKIRRAARPLGCSDFMLEVGYVDTMLSCYESEDSLFGNWEANTPEKVRGFLEAHGSMGQQKLAGTTLVVRLFLIGELMAAVMRENRWTVRPDRAAEMAK